MFSLVVPIYRNEAAIPSLIEVLAYLAGQMNQDFEAILVVDGSPDRSLDLLLELLPGAPFASQLLVLSRNFGSFAAITAGFARASGELSGVMAADLQEPPDLILEFRERLLSGDYDIVVGARAARADPLPTRLLAAAFWWIYRKTAQREMIAGGVDVFACTQQVRQEILRLKERNGTLVGLLFWVGFRRCAVTYQRRPREHGVSAWSTARRFRYLLDSLFAFTVLPLRLLSLAGSAGVVFSTLVGAIVLVARILGTIDVPGYTATILTVIFFGALNSLGLGIIGEYLWRTFENTKGRPNFIVAQALRFGGLGADEADAG